MKTQFKLRGGDELNRSPNKPIITAKHNYVWIGNDAPDDMMCFATLSGRKTLLALARAIKAAAMRNRP